MGSLQDQMLKAGLIDDDKLAKSEQDKKAKRAQHSDKSKKHHQNRKHTGKKTGKKSGKKIHRSESDLAAAYRAKQKAEQHDKEFKKQQQLAEQEARRLRNKQLEKLVDGKPLNDDSAELPRYFNYMNKIRRILLTQEQLDAVNNNELGIAVLRSRPMLLDKETLAEFKAIAPDLVPDLGGDEPKGKDWDEQYAGFEVPDDLRW